MKTAQTLQVPGYRVMRFLGSGARSTIWEIRERRTDQRYALKRVLKRCPSDMRHLQQALNEYQVAQQLHHPIIRQVHEIRRIRHWLSLHEIMLVMEYCEGSSVQDSRPGSVLETVRAFLEVAKALTYMNSMGFVHADTKPNNIIVAPDGLVKIIDFGQSCRLGTIKQRIQGTPDFIAPEQVHRRPLDARTDVYNFGASLYWTLTRRPIPTALPQPGKSMLKTDAGLTPAEQFNPNVPASLSKLIVDCVETRPSRRPSNMNDVRSRLSLIEHTLRRHDGDEFNRET